jgi:hypothetical protein
LPRKARLLDPLPLAALGRGRQYGTRSGDPPLRTVAIDSGFGFAAPG